MQTDHRVRTGVIWRLARAALRRSLVPACALLSALPATVDAQQSRESVLHGRVVAVDGGESVSDAEVVLRPGRGPALTDGKGRFRFDRVAPGRYLLEVQRIGFQTRLDTLDIPAGVSLEVTLEVSVELTTLPEILVVTRSRVLESKGFYDRQRQGFRGVFFDRPAIEDRDPLYVTDMFRNVPGVEVMDGHLLMSQSVTLRGGGRGCEPSLWLDGIRSNIRNYHYIRPDHLEGIEIYTGGGAPAKYNDLCGTVVIWTRVPVRNRR